MAERDIDRGAGGAAAARIVPATDASIAEAGRLLRAGELVAFPTETVYGLGGDATSERAVARIFAAKDRPRFNPLIVHFAEIAAVEEAAVPDARARRLAARFWPGPLTLVLPRAARSPVARLASAGLDSLAVRVPAHEVARAVVAAAGRPVAAPSANRSGRVSPTRAAHVADELDGRPALILDGGACPVGVESTIVDLTGPRAVLLRPGGLPVEAIEAEIGPLAPAAAPGPADRPKAPGGLASHYAPRLPLRLGTDDPRPGEALLAFGPDPPGGFAETLNLSPSGDLEEAAANLFAMLRALDRPGFTGIAAMEVPDTGLGRAIRDRLRRAAAPLSPAPPGE